MAAVRPRQLILSLYGLYGRGQAGPDPRNWLSVAALVRLMADLDVDPAAVRSSVSRLKKRDLLRSVRVDGRAGYALSPATEQMLADGDVRIFDRPRARPADGWLVAVFSVPEAQRGKRHALRSQLGRLGFGTAAPGVWVAPGTLHEETAAALGRSGLAEFVEFFRGDYLGPGRAADQVGSWWDLERLERRYADFRTAFGSVRTRWRRRQGTDREAFAAYVPMLTAWRRLPYADPGLPLEYLPRGWQGTKAARLFGDLDGLLRDRAAAHARAVLHG